jgi:hypothetical protein
MHGDRLNGLAVYGMVGFTLSLIVHLFALAGVAVQQWFAPVWLLHVGIFPLFFVFVFRLRRWRNRPWWRMPTVFGVRFKQLVGYVPRWLHFALPALMVYVLVNFVLATGFAQVLALQPMPAHVHLSPAQLMRAFSGHWLIFYAVPAVFFLYVPRDLSHLLGAHG